MESFTPVSALTGGVLIGLSAALLLALNGRVAGISGIVKGLLPPRGEGAGWRLWFIAGLLLGGLGYQLGGGDPAIRIDAGASLLLAGGFLVGLGTAMGNGCTSGHGVCGVSRLSPRSVAATLVFMVVAGVTVYLVRHVLGGGL